MSCTHAYLGARDAREQAQQRSRAGERIEATRCTDGCGGWLLVEPRTMTELEELAAAIRERSGNAPG